VVAILNSNGNIIVVYTEDELKIKGKSFVLIA
jgi:hypothetical protein